MDWLRERDKNSAYVHKVIRAKRNMSKVDSVCDGNGVRYCCEDIADQFVHHVKKFQGNANRVTPTDGLEDIFTTNNRGSSIYCEGCY